MNIGEAIELVKSGKKITRPGLGTNNVSVEIRYPAADTGKKPHLLVNTDTGLSIPWRPTSNDILADDWDVVVE
jgi:hypothetical protein